MARPDPAVAALLHRFVAEYDENKHRPPSFVTIEQARAVLADTAEAARSWVNLADPATRERLVVALPTRTSADRILAALAGPAAAADREASE